MNRIYTHKVKYRSGKTVIRVPDFVFGIKESTSNLSEACVKKFRDLIPAIMICFTFAVSNPLLASVVSTVVLCQFYFAENKRALQAGAETPYVIERNARYAYSPATYSYKSLGAINHPFISERCFFNNVANELPLSSYDTFCDNDSPLCAWYAQQSKGAVAAMPNINGNNNNSYLKDESGLKDSSCACPYEHLPVHIFYYTFGFLCDRELIQ